MWAERIACWCTALSDGNLRDESEHRFVWRFGERLCRFGGIPTRHGPLAWSFGIFDTLSPSLRQVASRRRRSRVFFTDVLERRLLHKAGPVVRALSNSARGATASSSISIDNTHHTSVASRNVRL